MASIPIYTAGDAQDHLAALLLADSLFQQSFSGLTTIARSDPGGIDEATGVTVALDVATEGSAPGGTGSLDNERITLVLLVYVYAEQRDETLKRKCVDLTGYARAAVKRYKADKTPGLQLWSTLTFGAPGRADASAYIYQDGYYLSITPINLLGLTISR